MRNSAPRKNIHKVARAERHPVSIPISVGTKTGLAKDISATGIYFEIDVTQKVGSNITFLLELMTPGAPIKINCKGKVIRLENKTNCIGVAATIKDSEFLN
jgi:hypothetical protein